MPKRPADDVLRRIDATLEALFPPDDALDEATTERILEFEIELDEEADDTAGPPDLHGCRLLYGILGDEVVFVDPPTVDWIEAAIPRVHSGELDWFDDVPWVQRDQVYVLPELVIEQFGTYASTALDGPVITFRAADADAIVDLLTELGARCLRDDARVERVCIG